MLHAFELYGQWLRRDLSQRFGASILGRSWLLVQPLLLIVVVTWVFNGIFQSKWPGGDGSALDYGLKVLVGVSIHAWTADILNRACTSITSHSFIVTKVRFPLAMIPAVSWGVSTIQLLVTMLAVLVAAVFINQLPMHQLLASILIVPLILLPAALLLGGLCWGLAGLGTYLKDIGNVMPAFNSLLMFAMPVFYPSELVPKQFSWVVQANPVAFSIDAVRSVVFSGAWPNMSVWTLHMLVGVIVFCLGWCLFARLRPGFVDVL